MGKAVTFCLGHLVVNDVFLFFFFFFFFFSFFLSVLLLPPLSFFLVEGVFGIEI